MKTQSHRDLLLCACALAALTFSGCGQEEFDCSTPTALLDAVAKVADQGMFERLPEFIEIGARDITFSDGVTEASAIGDVKAKLGTTLGQLGRVAKKMKERYAEDLAKEKLVASKTVDRFGLGPMVQGIVLDPFAFLADKRQHLTAEDLGDGTAALLWHDEPALGGTIALVETDDGWRVTVPVELVQGQEFWPQTREEWAVVASMMLAVENSLIDFERELDTGKFKTLQQATERIGRLLGESVVVQSVIYATMKQPKP
ncbi:MAG: hypothetical protein EXS10_03820 [Phycisphaerales bacterium]|nr:hypothetical protein [Phycisphaerales bacterium]